MERRRKSEGRGGKEERKDGKEEWMGEGKPRWKVGGSAIFVPNEYLKVGMKTVRTSICLQH